MSSDTSEILRRHFSALEEEEEEFTSSHSRTHSQLPGQLEAEEAKELEEALRLSAQEAMEEHKRKKKMVHKAPQEVGEPLTTSVTPKKRKASSETSASTRAKYYHNYTLALRPRMGGAAWGDGGTLYVCVQHHNQV